MSLKDIFCQDRAVAQLQRAINAGRVPHAYIFAGPDGVGKRTCALQWAKLLLCKNPTTEKTNDSPFIDSCGRCESCRAFDAEGAHPDFNLIYKELLEYTKEGKRKKTPVNLSIDVIREFVIQRASLRPKLSQSVVFVICEAEKLSRGAQNSLLKVLEEPPDFCFLILLCTRVDKLLPTTRSRCQTVQFGPVTKKRIVKELNNRSISETEARYWAAFTEGSLGQALHLAGLQPPDTSCYEIKKQLLNRLSRCELADALELAAWLGGQVKLISETWRKQQEQLSPSDIKRTVQKTIVRMIIAAFLDAMRLAQGLDAELINADQRKQVESIAKRLPRRRAAQMVTQAYKTLTWIESSVNEKLVFEQLLLNFAGSDIMVHENI